MKTGVSTFCMAIGVIVVLVAPSVAHSATPEETFARIRTLRKVDGEYQQAADEALAFLQTYEPKDMIRQKIHYEYAAALFQQQKFADAKQSFLGLVSDYEATALDKSSDDFMVDDAQYFAAMLEQTQGEKDIDKAVAAYKALVENYPKSNWRPNALMTLGNMKQEQKSYSESVFYYQQLVEEFPETDLAAQALFSANRSLIHWDNTGVA